MYGNGRATYQQNEVLTTSKEGLVPLLYEHLLKNLRRAAKQIEARDYEGKGESLSKASAIVFELLGSLDFEAGGDLAPRLAGLYGYFAREISEIGRTLDLDRLAALSDMVAKLHEAWAEAAQKVAAGEVTA